MDVLTFISILVFYIWVVLPGTHGAPQWNAVFTAAAVGVVVFSFWRRRVSARSLGMRLDNLLPACILYIGMALPYAVLVVYWHRDALSGRPVTWPDLGSVAGLLVSAFLQELCLLAFLLTRFREMLGARRPAVLAAAAVFAFFHLPNPFLTLYTLGGGLILTALYVRMPNIWAAAIAHALASAVVGRLLPKVVTGSMKVGPLYWWSVG